MVVTRKKLRSFKLSSIAQRWQDKEDSLQKYIPRKPTKAKALIFSKKDKRIVRKEQQKKTGHSFDKKALRSSLVQATNKKTTIREKEKSLVRKKTIKKEAILEENKGEEDPQVDKYPSRKSQPGADLNMSQETNSSVKYFKCADCEFTTVNQSHFSRHIKRQILTCTKCGFKTDLRCILHAHNEVCGEMRSKIKPDYNKSLEIIAEGGPVYFCDFCPFLFKERFEIVKHVKDVHKFSSTSNTYLCSCCDFQTAVKNKLRLHYVHMHKMQPENVKYIADRSFEEDEDASWALESEEKGVAEEKPTEIGSRVSSPKFDKRIKNLQDRKAEYLKNNLNTGFKRGAMNREGKENKKRQYIQRQLESLKETEQREIKQTLKKEADCLSETSENDHGSENSYSDQSDESEIAETIRVFFQDKAIEISLKKSMDSANSSTAKRKCIKIENN